MQIAGHPEILNFIHKVCVIYSNPQTLDLLGCAKQNLQLLQVNSQSDEIMANIKQSVILTEQKLSTDLLASQVVA